MVNFDSEDDASRLTKDYPAAVTDCLGLPSSPLTVYKTGPDWPISRTERPFKRELRPYYDPRLAGFWESDAGAWTIAKRLSELGLALSAMDIVGFANKGEPVEFCKAIVSIGVLPRTLTCDVAKIGAEAVKHALSEAGFADLEVAFRESESVYSGRLLAFQDMLGIPARILEEFRKPFTPTPGVAVARYDAPNREGTAGLYFRRGNDILLLTAAHVVRSPLPKNDVQSSHRREEIVNLGSEGFEKAVKAVEDNIGYLELSVTKWKKILARIPPEVAGESRGVTIDRNLATASLAATEADIQSLRDLKEEVMTYKANLADRKLGFIECAEPITVSSGPHRFTCDFALIRLYEEAIDCTTFPGNKAYVGGKLSEEDFCSLMFPRPEDSKHRMLPEDGLLQVSDVVDDDELRNPQHFDHTGDGNKMCLYVVKNGSATGTTVGRANGIKSFVRRVDENNVVHSSMEVCILPYDTARAPFSGSGDSGATILDRSGRIVALLNGGNGGRRNELDITYGTPYWWLENEIKGIYPDCQRYSV